LKKKAEKGLRPDLTEKNIALMCALCGSHTAIAAQGIAARLMSDRCCDCGANSGEVYLYYICETPCSNPSCLCQKK
jgi:hypothetical protein